ncbi:hypothetical protein AGMMS50229_06720 [Campylobacterota bacterium]|nr:hypothetical protein AGMMS50229_06720 [Campylobacterota bacterium]
MRAFWLIISLALCMWAKDNYVFDYRLDPIVAERLDAIDREANDLRKEIASLKKDQELLTKQLQAAKAAAKPAAATPKTTKPVASAAANKAGAGANSASVSAAATPKTAEAIKAVQTQTDEKLGELGDRLAKLNTLFGSLTPRIEALEDKTRTIGANKSSSEAKQIEILSERVYALENKVQALQDQMAKSAGLPFDSYLDITKTHFEYFILGLLVFVVLLFLLLLITISKAINADNKISQLVKLYQSSSRKIDERK